MSFLPRLITPTTMVALLTIAGCGAVQQEQKQLIKVAQSESAEAAIARIAKSLPPEQGEEFSAAAEALAFHYALRNPRGVKLSGPVKAIDGKTPGQVIEEYNRLAPETRQELAASIQSMKTSAPALAK